MASASVADTIARMRREEKLMAMFWELANMKDRAPRKEGKFDKLEGCIRGDCRRLCMPCRRGDPFKTAHDDLMIE
jgi:hypothetical protein